MRIALRFTFFLWLSSYLVTATHHSRFSRHDLKSHTHSSSGVLTSRQHRIRRDLLDVCINVNVNLLADASKLLGLGSTLGPLGLGSDIRLCLCLKDLDIYLDTNAQIQTLIGLLGRNNVATLITALINTSPEAQECTFPLNSHHVCSNSNPCRYECDFPYTLKGGACVCDAPYTSCNGVCGTFPNGCGSAAPRLGTTRTKAATNLAQAQQYCKPHESVCGIPGREDTFQFECLDTNSTITSCGGCVTSHPFYRHVLEEPGVDCTAISHVRRVGCMDRRCIVHSCQEGWIPNSSKTGCKLDFSSSLKRRGIDRTGRKQSERRQTPVCDALPIDPNLQSQLAVLVDLVVELHGVTNLLGGITGSGSSPNLPPPSNTSDTPITSITSVLGPGLVPAIVQTTGGVLSSRTVSSLLGALGDLSGLGRTAQTLLQQCGCLSNVLDLVEKIAGSVLSIQYFCGSNPVVTGVPLSSSISPSPPVYSTRASASAQVFNTPQAYSPEVSLTKPSSPSVLEGPGDVPGVVGLTSVLNGLGVASGPSSVKVDGLGNGIDIPVNDLLNSLGIGPLNARNGDSPISLNVTVDAGLNLDLSSLLQGVVELVNTLVSSLSSDGFSSTSLNPILVSDVVSSVNIILTSPTVPSLITNIDGLVASTGDLLHGVSVCSCGTELGASLDYILALAAAALELQHWCSSNSDPSPTIPLHPDVTSVPHIPPVPSMVPHGIHDPTSIISPTLIASPSHTIHTRPSPTTPAAPSSPTCTADLPIIVGLDHLLAELGLAGTVGIISLDGLVSISTDVLDVLDIGSPSIQGSKTRLSRKKRLSVEPNTTPTTSPNFLVEMDALVDLVLGLNTAVADLPSPAVTPSVLSVDPTIPPLSSIVAEVVASALRLVSSGNITELSNATDMLATIGLTSLQALDACACVGEMHLRSVYDYLVQIVEASLALENLCHVESELFASPETDSPLSTTPTQDLASNPGIIAGLTKLLNGIGLPISAVAEVDGLLDGGVDNLVNNVLDVLEIGPHGIRRHLSL